MKSIATLVEDIYAVIENNGGWEETHTKFLSEGIADIAGRRFSAESEQRRNVLSPSSLGTLHTCKRKLWYKFNMSEAGESLDAQALGTFFYGDILEVLVIALAMAAGHKVEGLQEEVEIHGLKGSADCIIDGVLVDVKSASKYGFQKFFKNGLREDDPFGYVSQLSSYLAGLQNDKRVINKTHAAFLVVQKDRFKLVLDMYDFSEEIKNKEAEINEAQEIIVGDLPDYRVPPVPDGKSGNMKLATVCSYCDFKRLCWPEARLFLYSTGPRYLTTVKKVPNVMEVTK